MTKQELFNYILSKYNDNCEKVKLKMDEFFSDNKLNKDLEYLFDNEFNRLIFKLDINVTVLDQSLGKILGLQFFIKSIELSSDLRCYLKMLMKTNKGSIED